MDTENKSWPMLLDMTKDECKQNLRALELSTYSKIVSVLRAQGELTKEKRKLLSDLQTIFSIPLERHRAEVRRAVNDETLHTVAEKLAGPNTGIEWAVEGRRLIPLMPRVPPQVAYTALATKMAQMYCGINAKMPKPCDSAIYGKMNDLGADCEMTDSEEETEGLRYITGSMVPQKYNADQGAYTTLPQSLARITMEKMKEKEEKDKQEMDKKNEKYVEEDSTSSDDPPSTPTSPAPVTSPGPSVFSSVSASPSVQGTASSPVVGAEKRKRKRSFSSDHIPPHPPPPPPPPPALIAPGVTQASALLGTQHAQSIITPMRQLPNMGSTLDGSSMKITVTGGITRSSTMPITSLSSHPQKVILVSTSAATGQGGSIYQRSISVPILKSTNHGNVGGASSIGVIAGSHSTAPGIFKGTVTPTVSVSSSLGGGTFVSKVRPRFASMTSSILSQGSSSLPGLPARATRQRSNSLILQPDGTSSATPTNKNEGSITRAISGPAIGQTVLPDSSSGGPLNILGPHTVQLRSGSGLGSIKSGIQVKQEGNKVIAQTIVSTSSGGNSTTVPTMVGSRIIGRASSLPSSSQGLYVVSTNSGTVTVVTRTVASGSITSPRVVTVNTVNSSRPSVVRGPSQATIVSVGINQKSVPVRQTSGIRPVIAGPKSNVIVVHKGSVPLGSRPVGMQGLRDISAKIITKPLMPGLSSPSSSGNISQGLLAGTLVVKPSSLPRSISSVTSSTAMRDSSLSTGSSTISSSNGTMSSDITAGTSNVIVLDFSRGSSPLGTLSTSTVQTNVLRTPLTSSIASVTSSGSTSSISDTKHPSESALYSNATRREVSASALSSSEMSTVSASSPLPSFKNAAIPGDSHSDQESQELPSSSCAKVAETQDKRNLSEIPCVSQITSSTSSMQREESDSEDPASEMEDQETRPSSSSLPVAEAEENDWLKLGLGNETDDEEDDDDEDAEMEGEEEEEVEEEEEAEDEEKSAVLTEESVENETDCEDSTSKTMMEEDNEKTTEDSRDEEGESTDEEKSTRDGERVAERSIESEEKVRNISESSDDSKVQVERNEKDGDLQLLVEKAVEVLKGGDSAQARSLLYKAGFELIDSTNDSDQGDGDGFCISSIAGSSRASVSSSSSLHKEVLTASQSDSAASKEEYSSATGAELDPTTGFFSSPPTGDSSSEEPVSNKDDSIADIDNDSASDD